MRLVISGTSYFACLQDVEPIAVTSVGFGCRVTLEAPDAATHEAWINRMIECATDMADDGLWDTTKALYADVERADIAAGRKAIA